MSGAILFLCLSGFLLSAIGTGVGLYFRNHNTNESPASDVYRPSYRNPDNEKFLNELQRNIDNLERALRTTKKPNTLTCETLQCLNGGTCHASFWDREWCDCPVGTAGLRCQVISRGTTPRPVPVRCDTSTCLNGGSCRARVFYTECLCPQGVSGTRCEVVITTTRKPDTCKYLNCQNGGYCVELGGSPARCVCPPNASGDQCDIATVSTEPTPSISPPPPPRALIEPFIIFSDENHENQNQLIKAAQLDGSNEQTLLNQGIDITYDYRKRKIFCTENSPNSKIIFANLMQRTPILNVDDIDMIVADPSSFQGLAFDWIHDNIYWADSGANQISVINVNSRYQRTLIRNNIGDLTELVVDPRDTQRWLYYIDTQGLINKVGLDGPRRPYPYLIETRDGALKHALTIDFKNNKLYWIALDLHRLECVDLNGGNRATVFTSSTHLNGAISIIQHGDFIYWSQITGLPEYNSYIKRINVTDISTFSIQTVISKSDVFIGIRDFDIFDSSRQPEAESACGANNGECSHLCLPAPYQPGSTTNYSCACPDGMSLSSDAATCSAANV